MPSIYSTIVAGIKQENISLFNLIFALEIALKKTTMSPEDKEFFLEQFYSIPSFKQWWNPNVNFVDSHDQVKKEIYSSQKSAILKRYPETWKLFETIEV